MSGNTEIISEFLELIKREAPAAFSYIEGETAAASTGLEYIGILGVAAEEALKSNLIPQLYKSNVLALKKEIKRIYTS